MKSIKIGSIVFYRVSQNDIDFVNSGRLEQLEIQELEIFPMVVTSLKKFFHPGEMFPRIEGHVFLSGGETLWVENVRHGLVDQYGGFPPIDKRNEANIEAAIWYSLMPKF